MRPLKRCGIDARIDERSHDVVQPIPLERETMEDTIMNEKQNETISVLNNLIETCEDGMAGYRQAAEHSPEPQLSTTFSRLSQQRSEYAAELRQEIRTMGGEPAEKGTVAGSPPIVLIS